MTSALRNIPHILKDTSDSILYELPQGKPDTSVPFKKGEMHLRPFVDQSAQKGSTCFFYALNILRDRMGPNAPVEYQKKREFEVLYSGLRKAITQEGDFSKIIEFQKVHAEVCYFFVEMHRNFHNKKLINQSGEGNFSKKDCDDLINASEKNYPPFSKFTESIFHDVRQIVDQFFNQSAEKNLVKQIVDWFFNQSVEKNLFKFAQIQLNKIETPKLVNKFIDFLNNFKQQAYDSCVKFDSENKRRLNGIGGIVENQVPSNPKWETLDFSELSALSNALALQTFDFKAADWNPTEPVDTLQRILKDKGPLLVGGVLGKVYYHSAPSIKHNTAGKAIYGWSPHASKMQDLNMHVIVVIGASQGGSRGGFVYFVDPNDGSSPNDPDQQKIYVISYQNFGDSVADSCGHLFKKTGLTSNGYAFYHSNEDSVEEMQINENQ